MEGNVNRGYLQVAHSGSRLVASSEVLFCQMQTHGTVFGVGAYTVA